MIDGGVPQELEAKIVEIANKCPVHRTLEASSVIVTQLTSSDAASLSIWVLLQGRGDYASGVNVDIPRFDGDRKRSGLHRGIDEMRASADVELPAMPGVRHYHG